MENMKPIFKITRQFKISNRNQFQLLRQFPLRLAAAKTIHRCQGDTLNELVVVLPEQVEISCIMLPLVELVIFQDYIYLT